MYVSFTLKGPMKPEEMLDFSHGGMLNFKYKGQFTIVNKANENILDLKSLRWNHALLSNLHVQKTKFEKK